MITASDFPRGFAEQPGSIPRLQLELAYGEVFDVGMTYYGEFLVSLEYAWELIHGGMTSVDGRRGTLSVAQRYQNAIQLRWAFDDV